MKNMENEIRLKAKESVLINYLSDNSLLHSNLNKINKHFSNKKIKKCRIVFNKQLKYIVAIYALLYNNKVEKKKNDKKLSKFKENIEEYSQMSLEMANSKKRFLTKEQRYLYSTIHHLFENIDFTQKTGMIKKTFFKMCEIKCNDIANKEIEFLFDNGEINSDADLMNKVVKFFYEYAYVHNYIDDEMLYNIKTDIVGYVLKNNQTVFDKVKIKSDENKRKHEINKNKRLQFSRETINKILAKEPDYIKDIAIISSSHNHATLHHDVTEEEVYIQYLNDKILIPLKFNVHYCNNCGLYFDFNHSFSQQHKSIDYDKLILNIKHIEDSKAMSISFNNKLEKSLLSKLGYKTGKSGISKIKRQSILKYAIESGLLSISEVKSHLEFCINFFKNQDNMQTAIKDWKDDMIYIELNQSEFNIKNKIYH